MNDDELLQELARLRRKHLEKVFSDQQRTVAALPPMRRKWPLEMWDTPMFEVYDEGEAKVIAAFYDKEAANEYIKWRNKKIAKHNKKMGITN